MKIKKKVVVAMSGGVDSSVAAGLLKEKGAEVIGLTMKLFSLPREACLSEDLRSCCGFKAVEDARRVAAVLGIPHYVVDLRKEFEKYVIEDFCREYARGRTPNPCIRCNEHIKFNLLWERAKRLGAGFIATGHHARVEFRPQSGRYLLRKGRDKEKDQSYFLYTLTQEQLSRSLLPIGDLTKRQVRQLAKKWKLPVAEKEESQEICFVLDNDYARFLETRIPRAFRPGPVVDLKGNVLGRHRGIPYFTVGQRKGMGIAAAHPLYVLSIDAEKNMIVVGKNDELLRKSLLASEANWISVERLTSPTEVKAKIRYKHSEAEAQVIPLSDDEVRVEFRRTQRAITPGQSVVFYRGEVVAGGGIILGDVAQPKKTLAIS